MSETIGVQQSSSLSTPYRELASQASSTLRDLITALGYAVSEKPDGGFYVSTETLSLIAGELSDLVGKQPHWEWRYLQGVLNGTVQAGDKLTQAIFAWGAIVDGQPAILTNTQDAMVRARPGQLHPGAVVLATSKRCANATCRVAFVPVVPAQKFCRVECRRAAHAAQLEEKR